MNSLEVRPLAGALGAMVNGINLPKVMASEQLDEVRKALANHLVVFLPEQHIDLDDLERITDLLGGRDTTPFVTPLPDRPYVIRVIKEPEDQLNFANAWHSDLSYLPEPPSYTLLHAAEVPEFGGDTLWSNQYLAYETLSRGLNRDTTPFVTPLPDRPYVIRVIKEPEDQLNFANAWHS